MKSKEKNYAFIDSQNLNLSIRSLGWKLDFKRFRKYLADKFAVEKAYLFIGFIEANNELYTSLQEAGFICIFKPTLTYKDGTTKGNCDAELVLQTMLELPNYHQAVIVTGDGDFYCLIKQLLEWTKLKAVLIPDRMKFSALLKLKEFRPYLQYMNELRSKLALQYEKKPAIPLEAALKKPIPQDQPLTKKPSPRPQQRQKKLAPLRQQTTKTPLPQQPPTAKNPTKAEGQQKRRYYRRKQKKRPQQDGT